MLNSRREKSSSVPEIPFLDTWNQKGLIPRACAVLSLLHAGFSIIVRCLFHTNTNLFWIFFKIPEEFLFCLVECSIRNIRKSDFFFALVFLYLLKYYSLNVKQITRELRNHFKCYCPKTFRIDIDSRILGPWAWAPGRMQNGSTSGSKEGKNSVSET